MKLIKVFVLFFTFTLLLFYSFTLIYSQDSPVPPNPIPCGNTADPEFHSLRPYQKNSKCQSTTSEYAKFCGNTLTLQETVDVTYQPGVDSCTAIAGGKVRCSYVKPVPPHTITIDLSDANLPIMGNTEEVTNYQGKADQLNDAQKVNEYVSWYLNGVTNRAEYTFLDSEKKEDLDKIINFSGPLKKLLPEKIQRDARVNTINNAKVTRHDQIVGCVYNLLGLFKVGRIVECYPKTIDKSYVRLSDWTNNNHLPPDENDPKFKNFSDYWIAYKEWRGKSCVTILGLTLCIDNPLKPNYWGNLFQNIPLSSTEDLEGNIRVDSASGVGLTNVTFDPQTPSTLFFSHLQESGELGSALQDTYIAKDEPYTGPDTAVAPASSCNILEVRSNKGDNLFATSITGNLGYTASFTCDFNPPSCKGSPSSTGGAFCKSEFAGSCVPPSWSCTATLGQQDCRAGYVCGFDCSCNQVEQTCSKTYSIALSTSSKTPKIDDVWSRLVGGPTAIVKRIFPKLGAQIGTLKDIPGSTSVTYSGAQASSAELNFPHIGGISEYFLKGIQTLLRPKGYGEKISFGEMSQAPNKCNYTLSDVDAAIQKASSMYHMPTSPPISMPLLRTIFEIEGIEFIADPKNYVCEENDETAAGIMQITKATYNYVTCPEERLDNDLPICKTDNNKLSRCDVEDAMILAARTLLWKDGKIANCNATGPMSSDKMSIYNASCKYYGTFSPTPATINAVKSIPIDKRRQNGDMNYCDIICYKTGLCPPYP